MIDEARTRCAARHMTEYAAEARWLSETVAAIQAGTIKPRSMEDDEPRRIAAPPYQMTGSSGNIAVISIVGAMMKGYSKYADVDTLETRKAIRKARMSGDVHGVMLRIDSPGGAVDGTMELAEDVAALAKAKPTHTRAEDTMASAALWVGSQASRVSANPMAEIGSIGVFCVVHDTSGMAEMEGVKVHVINTGGMKGAFAAGTPVTDEQLAYLQERVMAMNDFFVAGVRAGRGMSEAKVREISAGGKTYLAADALKLGLIDAVETWDKALSTLEKEVKAYKPASRSTRAAKIGIAERA